MSVFEPQIVIVGAGPSGLLLTLLLARLHTNTNASLNPTPTPIKILLLDSSPSLDTNPRATHYGGPAMSILRRAGVVDDMKSQGFIPDTVCWRKLGGGWERIAGIGFGARSKERVGMAGDGTGRDGDEIETGMERIVCLPLNKLGKILCEHLKAYEELGIVWVEWGRKVVRVGQDGDGDENEDESEKKNTQRIRADYVVGCDGANSVVRKSRFGNGEDAFPGKTWEEQIVATNTYYDFDRFGWEDSNFIIDPVHWYMAARISTDGMWRVTYGELPGLTNEQLRERQPGKFEAMLPGHPTPDQYRVVNFSPYRVHQRLAKRMRVGRVLLAADAAHLCNPFGGMGLTSGIVDVGALYDCFHGIYSGRADADSILEKCHEIRSRKFHEVIDPVSTANILRLFDQDPDKALERDPFLKMCRKAETDVKVQEDFARAAMALSHDFTQYYRNGDEGMGALKAPSDRSDGVNVVGMPVAVSD